MPLNVGTQDGGGLGILVAAQNQFISTGLTQLAASVQVSQPTVAMVAGIVHNLEPGGMGVTPGEASIVVAASSSKVLELAAAIQSSQPLVTLGYIDRVDMAASVQSEQPTLSGSFGSRIEVPIAVQPEQPRISTLFGSAGTLTVGAIMRRRRRRRF